MNALKTTFGRIWRFILGIPGYALRHKLQAGAAVLVIATLGWWGYSNYQKNITATQYVLAFARTAPIQETVTGSGQIASEHQLNLSPKASGTIASVSVSPGDAVVAGQVVATLDMTDASKTLRDAKANLESARISYEQSKTSNGNTAQKSSDSLFSTASGAYSDMNTVLTGIDTIINGNEVSGSYALKNAYAYSKLFNDNAALVAERDRLITDYISAKDTYTAAIADYNSASRTADVNELSTLADESYRAAESVAQAAKDLNAYLSDVNGRYSTTDSSKPAVLATHLSSSLSYTSTMNSDVNSLLSTRNDLASASGSGNTGLSLDEQATELSYQKAQNSYQDALDTLANYVVRAPFAGTIASVPLQKFDNAGSGTTVAVLITKQQIATLSLNEVDAAKVKAGQKATLTFDAVDGLTVDGTVAEVDGVGAVSQGVVSYTVKIGFATEDPRILPGMTVNATIVTASKDDALVVPSSAIKTQGATKYVEVATFANGEAPTFRTGSSTAARMRMGSSTGAFASSTRAFGAARTGTGTTAGGPTVDANMVTTKRVTITTGIVGDTTTEITSGLTAGEFVISQSLNSSGKSTTQTPSLFNLFGGQRRPATGAAAGAARTTTGGAARPAGGNAVFVGRPGG